MEMELGHKEIVVDYLDIMQAVAVEERDQLEAIAMVAMKEVRADQEHLI
jgi:hypothetical protein